jgi:hypothetical protein
MLRGAPRRRRDALLIRGPRGYKEAWVPAPRCSASGAAPRPGHGTPPYFSINRPEAMRGRRATGQL